VGRPSETRPRLAHQHGRRCRFHRIRFDLLRDKSPEKSQRVMKAMRQMDEIDITRLQEAYDQR